MLETSKVSMTFEQFTRAMGTVSDLRSILIKDITFIRDSITFIMKNFKDWDLSKDGRCLFEDLKELDSVITEHLSKGRFSYIVELLNEIILRYDTYVFIHVDDDYNIMLDNGIDRLTLIKAVTMFTKMGERMR